MSEESRYSSCVSERRVCPQHDSDANGSPAVRLVNAWIRELSKTRLLVPLFERVS